MKRIGVDVERWCQQNGDEKKMVKEIGTEKKGREYYSGLKQVGCTAKFEENLRLLKYKRRRNDASPSLLPW